MKTAEAQKLKERFAAGKEHQESTSLVSTSLVSYAGDGEKAGVLQASATVLTLPATK